MEKANKNQMIDVWKDKLKKLSGNLTTNEYMSDKIRDLLLEENDVLKNKLFFEDTSFPKLSGILNEIEGLDILAGLQRINNEGCLTVYRAVRFPTHKRIYEMIYEKGCAIPNYEQERILELYQDKKYSSKREEIQKNRNFWTQPQERVVHGLPVFILANDALQIHRAFRNTKDKVAMITIHIPHELIKNKKVKLIANAAVDLDYDNCERDFEIKDFVWRGKIFNIDYNSLRARGIDLHEMYLQNLPWTKKECKKLGIEQEFFMLDIYEIKDKGKIKKLFEDSEVLKENKFFLHGFFGDQNIFARREAKYLPYKCQRIKKIN